MTISRREFLGGMLAGLGAALARKLPKAGAAKRTPKQIVGKNAEITWDGAPLACGVGRGSPYIFDNLGMSIDFIAGEYIMTGAAVSVNPTTGYVERARHDAYAVGVAYTDAQTGGIVDIRA